EDVVTGLVTLSSAPQRKPVTTSSSAPRAVSMRIACSGRAVRSPRQTSKPDSPGSITSSTTSANPPSSAQRRPSSPVATPCGSYPWKPSRSQMPVRIAASSSTTRMAVLGSMLPSSVGTLAREPTRGPHRRRRLLPTFYTTSLHVARLTPQTRRRERAVSARKETTMEFQGPKTTNGRRRAIMAGALLATTALAGVAARVPGSPAAKAGTTTFTAPAGGPVSFTGTLDRTTVLRGKDGTVRMELVMAAAPGDAGTSTRLPTDLVVILDRSGSMDGEKLVHAKAAVRDLMGRLGPDDRFALVTYSNAAQVAVPLGAVSDQQQSAILSTLAEIRADGGTNISGGLDVGLDLVDGARAAGRQPRAILISDGLANQGDPSPEGLRRRATRAARAEYMLSAVGVGADFNEYLMTALADAGTGNYYYLKTGDDLASVFARELDGARMTVASALAVTIEPAPGVRVVDAAGYPLESVGSGVAFRPGSLFAGQARRVWVTLAVPSTDLGEREIGRIALAYAAGGDRKTLTVGDLPRVACVAGEKEFFAGVDSEAWTRSVVVDSYNKM